MRVDTDTLGERIAEHVAHIDAAMHLLLTDLREFDKAGGWSRQGFQTCAHWLSWRVGWTLGTAREHVRVANKLAELPQIDESLRTGEMSYCKVRAMTRVATPANEATLLGEAQHTTGHQLETICRKYALVQRHGEESNAKDDSERRYVKRRDQPDGMVQIVAALHPEEAAAVWAALDRIVKEGYRRGSAAGEGSDAANGVRCDISVETPSTESIGDVSRSTDAANDVRCDVPAGTRSPDSAHGGDVTSRSTNANDVRFDVPAGTSGVDATGCPESRRRDRDSARAQRFARADALLVMAEEVIRGSRPNRSPIELVITVAAADLRAGKGATNATSATSATSAMGVPTGTNTSSASDIDTTSTTNGTELNNVHSTSTSTGLGESPSTSTGTGKSLITSTSTAGHANPTAVACYADGTAVSLAVVRRLACDAGLVGIVEGEDGSPLSVGRKTRAIPAAMKRALLKRDGCCRFPGCTNRIFVEGHHLEHWIDGGETKLRNILTLCRHHHRFVHEYGYTVELNGTDVRFTDPDGNLVRAVPEPMRPARLGWETIRARNAELAIDADTPACGWDGGRVDLVACIDDLVRADDRAARRMEM